MANSTRTTARFTPYSFDEMLRPLMYLQQKHDVLMDANTEMASKLGVLEHYLPKESKVYKELYAPYMERLSNMATKLTERGVLDAKGNFSPEMVNELRGLKADYGKTYVPIEDALKRYKARIENDVLVKNKDPHMIGVFGKKDLDDFYLDPTLGTDSYISGDQFYAEAAKSFQALARGEFNSPRLKAFAKYYDLFSQTAGMTPDQVIQHITNSKGGKFAEEFLQAMFENQLDTFGYTDKLDNAGKNRLFNEFRRALPHLTGPTQNQLVDNGVKEQEMMALRAQYAAQQQQDQLVEEGDRYIDTNDATGNLDDDRLDEAESRRKGFRESVNSSYTAQGAYMPNSINNTSFNKSSSRYSMGAYMPAKGTIYYDMMTRYYNSNPVVKNKVLQILNKQMRGLPITAEDDKLMESVKDSAIQMEYGLPISNTPGSTLSPSGVKHVIDNVQYTKLKGANVPEGMTPEEFAIRFKGLENPKMTFNLSKNKVIFTGQNMVDKQKVTDNFELPLKSVLHSKTIDISYFDRNGNQQQERIPVEEAFSRVKQLSKSKREEDVRAANTILNNISRQIAGSALGTYNVSSQNFGEGQTKIDLTQ